MKDCPFCKGTGKIEAESLARLPKGWMPLKVLAVKAGLSRRQVMNHQNDGLLTMQYGAYLVVGGAHREGWVIQQYEARRYLAWLAKKRNDGRIKPRHRSIQYEEMIDNKLPVPEIAKAMGVKPESVRTYKCRRLRRLERLGLVRKEAA